MKRQEKIFGLSWILPAHNESGAIQSVLEGVFWAAAQAAQEFEVIVVDDGSTDETGSLAQQSKATLVRHPSRRGYGRAILSGLSVSRYSTIAIMDADGTYPCDRFPEMAQMYLQGFDMVVGARRGPFFNRSFSKMMLRWIFRLLAQFTTGQSIPDVNSGFRIFRKEPVLAFRQSLSTGFSFSTTTTLLFILNGYGVGYCPIPYHKRVGKTKIRLFPDALRSLQIVLSVIAQFNPLKLYFLLAILSVMGNAVLGLLTWVYSSYSILSFIGVVGFNSLTLLFAISILAAHLERLRSLPPVLTPPPSS
jgi:glycosyltransferase involved in cell wall biosynthesis